MQIFSDIDRTETPDQLLDVLRRFYATHGFGAVCIVLPDERCPDSPSLYERGMPAEWMAHYTANNFAMVDPIPKETIRRGQVKTLRKTLEETVVTDLQRAYLDEFSRSEMTDGLAMSTHGPRLLHGFFGLAQVSDKDLAAVDRSLMFAVAQHAHRHIDALKLEPTFKNATLSPREIEVLRWVAAGKSNPEIATILDISQPTVVTHLKRLFSKLGVNERVSAAMMGLKLGLLS